MEGYQLENLIKAIESCFKQNYCAMRFDDIVMKFHPEIKQIEIEVALQTMTYRGQLQRDSGLIRLIVK